MVNVTENTAEDRFEITVEGDLAGFTVYRIRGEALEFFHTEIADRFDGQGLGAQLVGAALDAMRERGTKTVPTCSFVATYIERHPEYADLVQ